MISQYLQNLVLPSHLAHSQSSDASLPSYKDETGLLRSVISKMRRRIIEVLRKQSKETEIREAAEHLHGLTDEQLLDMGITWMDIAHVVRHGKPRKRSRFN